MKKKKFWSRILLFLMAVFMVLPSMLLLTVSAESTPIGYKDLDRTSVMEDLEDLGIDHRQYPIDETIKKDNVQDYIDIIAVTEFGYDYFQELEAFALYIYVYNPTCTPLASSTWNKIQMSLTDRNNVEGDWTKYNMKRLTFSEDHRFYKFRVEGISKNALKAMDPGRRIYTISGIEFLHAGESNATDYDVSGKYTFTGFLTGCGVRRNEKNTLFCSASHALTFWTELEGTSWRSEGSAKGEGYYYDVSGVYFAVPNWIINKYGNKDDPLKGLTEVEGEYWEYKANGIVTDSLSTRTFLRNWEGTLLPNNFDSNVSFSFAVNLRSKPFSTVDFYADKFFNIKNSFFSGIDLEKADPLNEFGFVFYNDSVNDVSGEDIIAREAKILEETGRSPYLNYVDEGRTRGWQTYKITAGETGQLVNANLNEDQAKGLSYWWSKNVTGNVGKYYSDLEYPALQLVDYSYILDSAIYTKEKLAAEYFIDEEEVDDLQEYVRKYADSIDTNQNCSVFLMHFATTDAYVKEAFVYQGADNVFGSEMSGNNYYFEQTVFDDFDILSMTFEDRYGRATKVGVVASPEDIGPSLPPVGEVIDPDKAEKEEEKNTGFLGFLDNLFGDDEDDAQLKPWVKVVIIVLGFIVLGSILGILSPVLKPIFGLLGSLFGAVFRGIGALFRGGANLVGSIFTVREKTYDAKRKRTEDKQKDEDRVRRQKTEDEKAKEEKYDADRKRIKDKREDADRKRLEKQRREEDRKRKEREKAAKAEAARREQELRKK